MTVEISASGQRILHLLTLKRRATQFLACVGGGDLNIALVGDRAMRSLNRRFRGVSRATDVLSFAAPSGGTLLGDIAISIPRARAQARERGLRLLDEVTHLVCHGVLHLKGHAHVEPSDMRAMRREEARLLAAVGLPPLPWHSEGTKQETGCSTTSQTWRRKKSFL